MGQSNKEALLGLVLLWFLVPQQHETVELLAYIEGALAIFALQFSLVAVLLPLLGFIFLHMPVYDNFRQVLFLLPPVFLMAGIAFSIVKRSGWQVLFITLMILPGIADVGRLYPDEFIYYNRFIGGVQGVQKSSSWITGNQLSRSCTVREQGCPPDYYIRVEGQTHQFESFARKDLEILDRYDSILAGKEYYVVTLSCCDDDQLIAPEAEIIFTVSHDGAPLAVVKKP